MNKDTTFSQYLAKEKLKGNYTYDLQLDEGIGDIFAKSWHNTKKHLSGNLSDDKVELWRLNLDFTNRGFRETIIDKCASALKEFAKTDDLANMEGKALEAIKDTVNSTIKKIVGLARGANTKYDNPSDNPGDDEKEKLYTDAIKGYKYSWVQDGHLYIYYDSKERAEDFKTEKLLEQKIIEADESIIQSMIKIEKCTRNKGSVYDKVESENRGWKKSQEIEKAKFTDKSAKVVYEKIKDELADAIKKNRYGKDIKCGRVTWEITDNDIEEFITAIRKKDENIKSVEDVNAALNNQFKAIKDIADKFHFLYGRGSKKGNIFLNFETLTDATNFVEEADGEISFGNFKEPKEVKINSNLIEQNKDK